ncbi:GntR family transcriptional regulator [Phyllobacterium sp. SB3]|uniref:GntR family transcriptional regulator n=1 Tax=Phyllobacterium sp. SB3 TaxID=3156073 RepID=UPI0032AE8D19
MTNATTPLQEGLIGRIYDLIHIDGLSPGARLNEKQLAEQLNVSRSPIRAALDIMAGRGLVVRRPQRGVELIALPPKSAPEAQQDSSANDLLVKIARDRVQGDLGDEFSETELMQRYEVARNVVRQALGMLADLDMAQRKPGYGWKFLTVWNKEIRRDSYRFRMVIEPAAILEPAFTLNREWARMTRRQHEASLTTPWNEASSVSFFEMNASFHEGIAAASGNRFFLESIKRQNRLRRLANYNWRHGFERVRENFAEHMAVLDQLEVGDFEMAALLMRRHLQLASNIPSQ